MASHRDSNTIILQARVLVNPATSLGVDTGPVEVSRGKMNKPILAMITQSIRMDNLAATKYFQEFEIKHFYHDAPYGDLNPDDLANVIQWHNFKDLENKLIELNPDLIQGAEPYASKNALRICLLTMKVAKKLNRPYFFPMLENRPVKARFNPIAGLVVKNILKKYAQNSATIFYLNEGAKRNLQEVGVDEKKLHKALYGIWGVDTAVFRPQFSIFNFKFSKKKYILFVGRFIEDKGIPYLLTAWKSIKDQFKDIDLVFIGSGELKQDIVGSQVVNLGQMKNSDLPSFFSNFF